MMMANAGAAGISMRLGWHGPCEVIVTACAAGTHAVAAAGRLVASGRCDVVLSGGAEASLHPTAVAAFANMTALSSSGRFAPLRRPPRRVRHDRGFRGARPRGLGPRRGPRGHHLRGVGGGGQHGRRPPHHRPRTGRRRRRGLYGARPERCRRLHRRRRAHQRARHVDPAERSGRISGHHQGLRRARTRWSPPPRE